MVELGIIISFVIVIFSIYLMVHSIENEDKKEVTVGLVGLIFGIFMMYIGIKEVKSKVVPNYDKTMIILLYKDSLPIDSIVIRNLK